MGVLHPFSAASKPMPDWDSLPSRPLPFAATLHSIDLNTQPGSSAGSVKTPRPRRHDVRDADPPTTTSLSSPMTMPLTPPASVRSRHGPVSPHWDRASLLASPNARRAPIGSDEWMQSMVAHCVDNAKCDLELSDYGLERLSTKIADLQHLVTLPQALSPTASPVSRLADRFSPSPTKHVLENPGRRLMALSDRTFSRTQSAPASSATFIARLTGESSLGSGSGLNPRSSATLLPSPFVSDPATAVTATATLPRAAAADTSVRSPLPGVNSHRRFERSKTGATLDFSKRMLPVISIYLSQNRLTSLPSALFEIKYLSVLSLRSNQLRSLPAAIGELAHLKELNISNNKLEYLPSTILNLSLEQFSAHNNNWRAAPPRDEGNPLTLESLAARVLSPIRYLNRGERTEAEVEVSNVPRLTSLCLQVLLSPRPPNDLPPLIGYDWEGSKEGGVHPLLDPQVLRMYMPALRPQDAVRVLQAVKSACAAAPQVPTNRRRSTLSRTDPFPRLYLVPEPDDASTNPFFSPCPSPRHREVNEHDHAADTSFSTAFSEPDPTCRHIFLDAAEERLEWVEICGEKNLPVRWLGCSPGCLEFLDEDEDEDGDGFDLDELDLGGESE